MMGEIVFTLAEPALAGDMLIIDPEKGIARRRIGQRPVERWWRYAVLRGDGIPAELDGVWFDLDDIPEITASARWGATTSPTNRWEQREDGAVAVVYEWLRR